MLDNGQSERELQTIQNVSQRASVGMHGIKNNDYMVQSWKEYYCLSLKHTESGVKAAKDQWFRNTHEQWRQQNKNTLESAHIGAEVLSQKRDPRNTCQYVKKEPDPRDDMLAAPMDNGQFWQKEKFKFKDFQKDDAETRLKRKKEIQK